MANTPYNQNPGMPNQPQLYGMMPPPTGDTHFYSEVLQKHYSWFEWAFGKKKILEQVAYEMQTQVKEKVDAQAQCFNLNAQIASIYTLVTQQGAAPGGVSAHQVKNAIKEMRATASQPAPNTGDVAQLKQYFPDCESLADVKKKFDSEMEMRMAAQIRVERAESQAQALQSECDNLRIKAAMPQDNATIPFSMPKPIAEEERAVLNNEIDKLRRAITSKNDDIAFKERNIAELKAMISELQAKVAMQEASMRNARQSEMSSVESEHVAKINFIEENYKKQLDMLRNNNRVSIETLKKEHQKELEDLRAQHKDEISAFESSKTWEMQQLEARYIEEVRDRQVQSDAAIKRMAEASQQNIEKIKEDHYDEIRAINEQHRMLLNKLEGEVASANRESESAAQALIEANKEKEQAVVGKQKALDQYAEAFSRLFFAAFNQILAIKKAHRGDKATSVLAKGIDEKIIDNYSYGLEEFVQACEKTIAEYKDRPDQLRGALRETFAECLRLDSANWMNVLARFYLYCKVPFIAKTFSAEGLQLDVVDRAFAGLENLLGYCGIKISYPRLFVDEYTDEAYKLQSIRNIDSYVPNLAEHVRSANTIVDLYLLGYDDGEQRRQPVVSKFA